MRNTTQYESQVASHALELCFAMAHCRRLVTMFSLGQALVLLVVVSTVRSGSGRRKKVGSNVQPDVTIQQKFEDIYDTRYWSEGNGGSGTGSSLAVTQYAMSAIRTVVNKFELNSLADVPCGGMHWMPFLLRDLRDDVPGFSFHGVDIVRSVIDANQARFANESWMQFEVLDFTRAPVPASVQLILCRDALQHLPLGKAVDALEMFSASGARFLLIGSYLGSGGENKLIQAGDYYDINLTVDPFSLTSYQHQYHEHTRDFIDEIDKHLLLFPVAYLQSLDYKAMRERANLYL